MGNQVNKKEKNPYWQFSLTGNIRKSSVEHPKGQPSPTGTSYKAPYWQPSPMEIEGKEKLGAPDWLTTPVKRSPMGNNFKAPDWQPFTTGIEGKEKLGEPD